MPVNLTPQRQRQEVLESETSLSYTNKTLFSKTMKLQNRNVFHVSQSGREIFVLTVATIDDQ